MQKTTDLHGTWIGLIHKILMGGEKTGTGRIELHNISAEFEAISDVIPFYYDVFGKDTYNDVLSVYSPAGCPKFGKNYHEKIYNWKGVNQFEQVVSVLKDDPASQSGAILLDGEKNKPCVLLLHFKIYRNTLETFIYFKSSDVPKKLLPDLVAISRISKELATRLNMPAGITRAYFGNAHVYESDIEQVKSIFKNSNFAPAPLSLYPVEPVIKNWEIEAKRWKEYLDNPSHYVNYENGYARFSKFLSDVLAKEGLATGHSLDVGCGIGTVNKELREMGFDSVGIDISDKMRDEALAQDPQGNYIVGNCLMLPFSDSSFDVVASRGVLISHVGMPYVRAAMSEYSRVLKKGGFAIFDYISHFRDSETNMLLKKAWFSREDIKMLTKEAGLEVVEFEGDEKYRCGTVATRKV